VSATAITALELDSSALNSTLSAIGRHTPKLGFVDMSRKAEERKIKVYFNDQKKEERKAGCR
jgi:hypothetical protein